MVLSIKSAAINTREVQILKKADQTNMHVFIIAKHFVSKFLTRAVSIPVIIPSKLRRNCPSVVGPGYITSLPQTIHGHH